MIGRFLAWLVLPRVETAAQLAGALAGGGAFSGATPAGAGAVG